ncbi:outer membrane beta-barrel protein [Shewanella glacialimarina]|uniref:outer membrane beta-barrel protein n=1 Tax=Shewanella glacialimarina TaxID=2590884 RepID=UPI001CF8ECC1|nr:outer membrane beta-barrel protein [Shewanella glacialimarina]UCX03843.1 porin family protein [Shewanella glacialimarina]
MKLVRLALMAVFTLTIPISHAEIFVAPFGGYSFGSNGLEVSVNDAQTNLPELNITESGNIGIMLGVTTNDPGNMYLLYSRQETDLRQGSLSSDKLTELEVNYFHLGGTLYFPNGNLKPYVTASAGLTQLRPSKEYSSETHFSMGIGGGVAYEVTQNVSLFADVRGYATFLNSDGGLFCNQTRCVWQITGDLMWQSQVNLGLEIAF